MLCDVAGKAEDGSLFKLPNLGILEFEETLVTVKGIPFLPLGRSICFGITSTDWIFVKLPKYDTIRDMNTLANDGIALICSFYASYSQLSVGVYIFHVHKTQCLAWLVIVSFHILFFFFFKL